MTFSEVSCFFEGRPVWKYFDLVAEGFWKMQSVTCFIFLALIIFDGHFKLFYFVSSGTFF